MAEPLRPCPDCGAPRRGPSCACGWRKHRPRRRDLAGAKREHRAIVDAWRAEFGDVCPGYKRPPHPASDLTADHPNAVALGGDPDQPRGVLCRSCNSTKGADEGARAREARR